MVVVSALRCAACPTQCLSGVADGDVCSDQLAVVLQGKVPVLIQTLYLCLCPGSPNSVFRSIQNL